MTAVALEGRAEAELRASTAGIGGMSEAEFMELHAATFRPLHAYLLRSSGDPALADDLTQEAYLRLLRARARPRDADHRRYYLFRIASNLLRDHFRTARRQPVPTRRASSLTRGWERAADHRAVETRRDLEPVLALLRPRERQLLWLAHVEEMSHREIARILGLAAGSVRLLLFRARRKLAALLRERGYDPEVNP